jgi:hypothetical protein
MAMPITSKIGAIKNSSLLASSYLKPNQGWQIAPHFFAAIISPCP